MLRKIKITIEGILIFYLDMTWIKNFPLRKVKFRGIFIIPQILIYSYDVIDFETRIVYSLF